MPSNESYTCGPDEPVIRDLCIGELLHEAALSAPDRVALIAGLPDPGLRRQWTYAELYARSLDTARALAKRFRPGERVAVWAPNIPEWLMAEFGCALAGVVLVTVNPALRAAELSYVLKQSRSAGIIVMPEFRGNQMLATVEEVRHQCPDLREVIRFDHWHEFLLSAADYHDPLPEVDPTDPVMIQYTSGTTGFPKGALLHHRGLVNNGRHMIDRMAVKENSTWISMMPMFHTGGCVLCVLGAVSKNATQVLVESFEPGLVLELIETYSADAFSGVPTMLVAMLEHPDFNKRNLTSVKAITSGGSTVPAAMVKRFEEEMGATFTIVFGQTECSPVASMTYPHDRIEDKALTVGPAMPGVEIKIVDPESGSTVPFGHLGEYCTRGYHVMHGYFDMPEATASTIDQDGWLHTGDLCTMDERGYCKVEGRLKDMIIRGGENIYPREIEELLYQHPDVGEVAVVGLPDERFGEIVGAFIRPSEPGGLDKDKLFGYVRKHLAPHKTPGRWFEVTNFPLTGSGKIQKFVLRKEWEDGKWQSI